MAILELIPDISSTELAKIDINQLPTQLKVIIRLIGIQDTWTLLSQYSGQSVRIPVGRRTDTWLHQIIHESSVNALIQTFAGNSLTLPKKDKIVMQIRNQRIYDAKTQGETTTYLAKRFQLTRRSIISICKRLGSERR